MAHKCWKYFAKGPWAEIHTAQWITTIMIMVNIGLGMAVIAGGIKRFPLPSYEPLIFYTQGNVWVWGLIITVAAMFMAVPFRWGNIIGLWLGMCWNIVWMACFTMAAVNYPEAAATAIPAYGGFAMIHAALLTARVIDKSGG